MLISKLFKRYVMNSKFSTRLFADVPIWSPADSHNDLKLKILLVSSMIHY